MTTSERLPHTVYLAVTAFFFTSLASSILMPFLPLYLCNVRHIPLKTAGLAFLVMGIGQLVISPIAGKLNDSFSPKTILFCSPAVRAVFLFALAWAVYAQYSFSVMLVLLFFASAAGGSTAISIDSYLARTIPHYQLNRAHSRLSMAMNIGWIIGPIGGAYLARTPFSLIFSLTAICCLFSAAMTFFFCPKPKKNIANNNHRSHPWHDSFNLVLKNRTYLWFLIGVFLIIGAYYQLFSNFSIYVTETLKISKNMLGTLYVINAVMIVALQLPADWLCKTISIKNKIILGISFFVAGSIGFALTEQLWQLIIALIFFTTGEMLTIPTIRSLVPKFSPKHATGSYIGIYGLAYSLGSSLGPYGGSLLYGSNLSCKVWLLWGSMAVSLLLGLVIFMCIPYKSTSIE